MECIRLTEENAGCAEVIFMEAVREDGLSYKLFKDREAFIDFFLKEKDRGVKKISLLLEDGSGFAGGCYAVGEDRAYITFAAVQKEKRRQGRGRLLLRELERELLKESKKELGTDKGLKYEIVFFNPMTFSWLVQGGNGADHPNAPGIDVGTGAYLFYKNCGYRDYAMQNSYYLKLNDYRVSEELLIVKDQLKKEGITFEIFEEEKHFGLRELIEGFQNPMWNRDILGEATKGRESRPILIVSDGGKAVGFTGPLDVELSGRGFFAGIGVGDAYRGRGIAKVLFCMLCVSLKDQGAQFMTLFTGENNPARNIYEAAGFHIVKTWADMRKESK